MTTAYWEDSLLDSRWPSCGVSGITQIEKTTEEMTENLPQLIMRRPHLLDLATPVVAEGFTVRAFRSGDEAGWNRLMDSAFERRPGQSDFAREMVADAPYRPERVRLVTDADNVVVATASCWLSKRFGTNSAVLHWVATDPQHAGLGLGSAVSVDALHQGLAEGRDRAFLLTDDFRIAALKTYLRLAFTPVLTHVSHVDRWRRILAELCWQESFEELLAAPLESFEEGV
jgi:mycothiol synthase